MCSAVRRETFRCAHISRYRKYALWVHTRWWCWEVSASTSCHQRISGTGSSPPFQRVSVTGDGWLSKVGPHLLKCVWVRCSGLCEVIQFQPIPQGGGFGALCRRWLLASIKQPKGDGCADSRASLSNSYRFFSREGADWGAGSVYTSTGHILVPELHTLAEQ